MPGPMDIMSLLGGGGGPPGGAPAPQENPMAQLALSSMGQLGDKGGGSSSQAIKRVDEALGLVNKLLSSIIPQISNYNPKVTRDLHNIAQRVLSCKMEIQKETSPDVPPDLLQFGLGEDAGNPMGMPPPGMTGGPFG